LILYIHGFRTTPNSFKAQTLKTHYGDNIIISNHPIIPQEAIEYLENIIKKEKIKTIIASSLGGFYATYLAQKYHLKTVLINPSVEPYKSLGRYLGVNSKDNGEEFVWKKEYMQVLERFKIDKIDKKRFFLFLQTGDEILDYRIAEKFYSGSKLILEEEGNHRFQGFERFYGEVDEFFNS